MFCLIEWHKFAWWPGDSTVILFPPNTTHSNPSLLYHVSITTKPQNFILSTHQKHKVPNKLILFNFLHWPWHLQDIVCPFSSPFLLICTIHTDASNKEKILFTQHPEKEPLSTMCPTYRLATRPALHSRTLSLMNTPSTYTNVCMASPSKTGSMGSEIHCQVCSKVDGYIGCTDQPET